MWRSIDLPILPLEIQVSYGLSHFWRSTLHPKVHYGVAWFRAARSAVPIGPSVTITVTSNGQDAVSASLFCYISSVSLSLYTQTSPSPPLSLSPPTHIICTTTATQTDVHAPCQHNQWIQPSFVDSLHIQHSVICSVSLWSLLEGFLPSVSIKCSLRLAEEPLLLLPGTRQELHKPALSHMQHWSNISRERHPQGDSNLGNVSFWS